MKSDLKHIAIIADGNRRWARSVGLETYIGHKIGFYNTLRISTALFSVGVRIVTFWLFSSENWARSKSEVTALMEIIERTFNLHLQNADKDVHIRHIGRKDRLPNFLLNTIKKVEKNTERNKKFNLFLAVDYGGLDEIMTATKQLIVEKRAISKSNLEKYIGFTDSFKPDLFIRTSGENRLSGFMTYYAPETKFLVMEENFPDFNLKKLFEYIQNS